MTKQYSLNEVVILPSSIPSEITSRQQVNPYDKNGFLPIFVSPMTSVIDTNNYKIFSNNKVIPILPRNCTTTRSLKYIWHSYSLDEFETLVNIGNVNMNGYHILIDIANGHMKKLYDLVREAKSKWYNLIIMIGNIAHPDMYLECCKAKVDYVRVGIGGGSVCTTSVQTAVHASHHWLITKIKDIQNWILDTEQHKEQSDPFDDRFDCGGFLTKTIADGGINTIDKAIKCLALGYDYVMIGKCFAQCEEACGEIISTYTYNDVTGVDIMERKRKYYGMSSIKGQKDISGSSTKNPEGIEVYVNINTTVPDFVFQLESALRSAMSYTGSMSLEQFKKSQTSIISPLEFKAYYK